MTIREKLANVLSDGKRHANMDMKNDVSHRFGAALLDLRLGKLDGKQWVVDVQKDPNVPGLVWYQFLGRIDAKYIPDSPCCRDCGSYNVKMRDDR